VRDCWELSLGGQREIPFSVLQAMSQALAIEVQMKTDCGEKAPLGSRSNVCVLLTWSRVQQPLSVKTDDFIWSQR